MDDWLGFLFSYGRDWRAMDGYLAAFAYSLGGFVQFMLLLWLYRSVGKYHKAA